MIENNQGGCFKFVLIVPVFNPDGKFINLIESIVNQSETEFMTLLIDSGDDKKYQCVVSDVDNIEIKEINAEEFNHGGTRQWGMSLYPQVDIYVFLTQDAILADGASIKNLLSVFNDGSVGAVYGRQLPHVGASLFASTAREINYGVKSHIYSFDDKDKFGIKTCFLSNSFAAYRRTAMEDVGGFPSSTILSEDMYVAAKMLMNGWRVAYAADACVYHSHNYSIGQEFKRYFDIGVFHARESWIRDTFGEAEGEGSKFVLFETKRIIENNPLLIFEMVFRDIAKLVGYRLGIVEKIIPVWIKKYISMNKRFWKF